MALGIHLCKERSDCNMRQLWCLLLWICWLSVMPGLAQVYRWTDKDGRLHYTDNPEAIPADRRPYSRPLSPPDTGDTSRSAPTSPSPPQPSAPRSAPHEPPAEIALLQQQARRLEQQIAVILQERQDLLAQLKAVRPIRMNPAFGQQRRRVDEAGHVLAEVEKQLDALYAELQEVQATLQEREQAQPSGRIPSTAPGEVVVDTQGHDQAYWRQRVASVQAQLQHAREQRQAILTQLAPETPEERSAFGRRGREVLQLVEALERTTQDIRAAEAALQAVRQEAYQAGAPAAWLQ
jgi:Domain of unknown function (DUF4124)